MKSSHHDFMEHLRADLEAVDFARHSLVTFQGKPLMKRAFFPGGNGLFEGTAAAHLPTGTSLILGSNFSAVSGFCSPDGKLVCDDETEGQTWRPLRKTLSGAGLDLADCFFTNAWPCLHNGTSNTTGRLISRWLRNPDLMRECSQFFTMTCVRMRPSMIVALGPGPAAFLAHIWPHELKSWANNNIAGIDSLPFGVVKIDGVSHRTVCTAIVHPSFQWLNAKKRAFPYRHEEGEIKLVKEADTQRQLLLRTQAE